MEAKEKARMFKCIKKIDISFKYNNKLSKFEEEFRLIPFSKAENKWASYIKKHYHELLTNRMYEFLTNGFIDENEIETITYCTENLEVDKKTLELKKIEINCFKNKTLNISLPKLNRKYLNNLYATVKEKNRLSIISKYLEKDINNIIIFPSNHISEVNYYSKIIEEQSDNVLGCFNFHPTNVENKFLDISDLIYEIIEDFYDSYKNKLDGYFTDTKKTVVTFSNNKRLVIYDKDFIKQNESFFNQLQNDLIDKKVNKQYIKRKVLNYGTNNNGKNG